MPRKAKKKETMSGYFRQTFKAHPEWLQLRSNNDVLSLYRSDHGLPADADVGTSIKNTLSNLKSVLRSKQRKKAKVAKTHPDMPRAAGNARIDTLEEMIDDCMSLARSLDRNGLRDIIRHLHAARNKVVWRLGQP